MRILTRFHNFFEDLPAEIREQLDALADVREIPAGAVLYRQGDKPDAVYQLLEGSVRLCNFTLGGKEMLMGQLCPGDCFGEMGVIDGASRVSHAIADVPSRLWTISAADFKKMYDLHSELVKSINRVLCNRVRLLYGMTEDASSLSLQERLGRALHRLAYSNGDWSEEGRINLDISHENLGRMLGASRQSVNKVLKALERDGCIAIHYGKLSIIDLGQLQQRFDILLGQEQIAPDRQPGSDR